MVLAVGYECLSSGFCWTCHMPRSGHSRPGLRVSLLLLWQQNMGSVTERLPSVCTEGNCHLCTDLCGSDLVGSCSSFPWSFLCVHIFSCSGRLSVSGLRASVPPVLCLCSWHGCLSRALPDLLHPHLKQVPITPSQFLPQWLLHTACTCVLPCFPHWNLNSTRTAMMSACLLLCPAT